MILRLKISHESAVADEPLSKYISRKIGRLDRYLSRQDRETVRADVRLKEKKSSNGRGSCVEVSLHLPRQVVTVSETNVNMYAAIDIVEMKLRHQIMKYKQTHANGSLRRRLAGRFQKKPQPLSSETVFEA